MPARPVIVDGSNIATEGRSLPSLSQLDQAVREFLAENPGDVVTVVVDASFGHRIDPSELPMFEDAERAGELVSPPAGAIGRGDAFLLRIAEKAGATVLSNDSFQEFHGEHAWLFDKGRLIGGKPVPGVGWIFMPRTPVRGQKSREVVKEAKRKKRAEGTAVTTDGSPAATGLDLAASRAKGRGKKVDRAIARATEEAVEPKSDGRRRRKSGIPPAEAVNEPLPFITFIAAHPLGTEVVGTVAEFSSHGAFVEADGARCYLPLSAMGDPPPRRAREVVAKGEERTFVVQALDPQRRGIELALPGFARVVGAPTDETVEAEIHPAVGEEAEERPVVTEVPAKKPATTKKAAAKKSPVKKAAAKKPPAKKAAADKPAGQKKAAADKPAGEKKAAAKKVTATEPPAPAAEAAPARKAATARKVAIGPVKAAAAGAAAPAGDGRPGRKVPAAKEAQTSKKAGPVRKAARDRPAAKRVPVKKAAADPQAAKKAAAKKVPPPGNAAAPEVMPAASAPPAEHGTPGQQAASGQTPAKRAGAGRSAAKRAAPGKTLA